MHVSKACREQIFEILAGISSVEIKDCSVVTPVGMMKGQAIIRVVVVVLLLLLLLCVAIVFVWTSQIFILGVVEILILKY